MHTYTRIYTHTHTHIHIHAHNRVPGPRNPRRQDGFALEISHRPSPSFPRPTLIQPPPSPPSPPPPSLDSTPPRVSRSNNPREFGSKATRGTPEPIHRSFSSVEQPFYPPNFRNLLTSVPSFIPSIPSPPPPPYSLAAAIIART